MTRHARTLLSLTTLVAATTAHADGRCRLGRGEIRHVIYITFDNTHLRRDNPNVPSDLEQMPHLLSFLERHGALLSRHHTPLIAHTGTDLLTAATGLYGDRHGVPVSNSFRYFNPDGSSNPASAFAYWTSPLYDFSTATPTDTTPQMLGGDGKMAPAPWVAWTRAGCDVGAVGSANIVLENIGYDIATVFGAGSPEAKEAAGNAAQATADFVGIAVHCSAGSSLCRGGQQDLLPDEKGGYRGFQALFGHRAVAPALAAAPLTDLDGNVISDGKGHVGFPGFDGMSASVSLGYVAAMQERGIPVTYAYISDAHDDHVHGRAFGPGEAGYVAQLAAYDAAFARFFARLDRAGIDERNTLFVFTADEGDHFVGGAPAPATCDGVHVPCTYDHIGELDVNLTGLLANAGSATPWKIHSDSAPNLWVQGNPAPDAPVLRTLERALATLSVDNLLTGATEPLINWLADATEMRLLHMVTADPARLPSLTAFARPDYYVTAGAPLCSADQPCVTEPPAFAWNHGDVASEINVTWLGLVGPGVAHVAPEEAAGRVWTDHADVRPTMLALVGLRDDYVHQGRVVPEAIERSARPPALDGVVDELGRVYKQLDAPVGRLGLASLRISTKALASGGADGDEELAELRAFLSDLTGRRDALAAEIETVLDEASFGGHVVGRRHAQALLRRARQLIEETVAVADFVDLAP